SKVAGLALILAGLGFSAVAIVQSDEVGPRTDALQIPISDASVTGAVLLTEVTPVSRAPAAVASDGSSAPAVATVAPHRGERHIPQERFASPKDRDSLTRELQKELRRVGCYHGEINGTWSQSTRGAMKVLIERVNARLPIEEPDAVLYALVKG